VRRLAPVLFAVFLVLPSMAVVDAAPATAAAINPKVVLIVGATHATTPQYRAAMEQTYQTVRRYTTNVVRVYSPDATWSAAKTAMQGASIVVYMGHGNGYPNPYVSFARPEVQNGFGLNAAAGQGDYNNKYYGEQYIAAEVRLAPSAVVILSHACYSAGNSEPGMAEPSLSVAKQRLDNFAAGFLKAGARAVIAEVYGSPDPYIVSLFTTHQTIEQIWRNAPTFNNNVFTFPSVRSPGYTAFGDPESRWSQFRRSLVGKPDLRSDDVTGAAPTVVAAVPPTATMTRLPTWAATNAVALRWSATAGTSPVASYDVRYRRAKWNGGFGSRVTWRSATTATRATFSASSGYTYCFSVRARDANGSVSAWTAETCTAIPLDDRSLARTASWVAGTGSAYYRSTYLRSYTYSAKLTRTGVVAKRIALLATTCSTCGTVKVYWGSTLLKTVSLYSKTTVTKKLIPVASFGSGRRGTLTIKVSSSGKKVIIDGVAIRRN
jgi:hypothetical protein